MSISYFTIDTINGIGRLFIYLPDSPFVAITFATKFGNIFPTFPPVLSLFRKLFGKIDKKGDVSVKP